jgi:hypothetical protein
MNTHPPFLIFLWHKN